MSGDPFERNNEQRWPVLADGALVGGVTSAVHSPRLDRNIGFAIIDVPFETGASPLTVETPEGDRDIEITTTPFIDPEKRIPRAPLR